MKIVKDCIYGNIVISPLCLAFMDVPQFQRLRRIRQLGICHYVYPSATHTRFEHSIGVMHLAGKMVDQLRRFLPVTDNQKELIELGALYHDIGHAAYSHLFDKFLKNTEKLEGILGFHRHEDRSKIFLKEVNDELKLLSEEQLIFVQNVIDGRCPSGDSPYLYEIVNNSLCGVDVDKLDYLARDSYHTGMSSFQSDYIILCAGIKNGHLAFLEKARKAVTKMFETRQYMFETVYVHKTTIKVERYYYCLMKRLGQRLFSLGGTIDDYNVETLIRSDPELSKMIAQLDRRKLNHSCDFCSDYIQKIHIKQSGNINQVLFF